MYNNEIKEQFIEEYLHSRAVQETSIRALFKKTEKFEVSHEKDICTFTLEEIVHMFDSFNAKTVAAILFYNYVLKAYVAYCDYNNLFDVSNAVNEVTYQMLREDISFDKTTFYSLEQINDIINSLFNWSDKAIVRCMWEGICGARAKDITSITLDMLDLDNGIIRLSDERCAPATDELLHTLVMAIQETEYVCYSRTRTIYKRTERNNCVYKETSSAHGKTTPAKKYYWVYRKMCAMKNFFELNDSFTMHNIVESGMLHNIKRQINPNETLRQFLYSEQGKRLCDQYCPTSPYNKALVDRLCDKYYNEFKRGDDIE